MNCSGSPVSYFWLSSSSTPKFCPIFPTPCPPLLLLQEFLKELFCCARLLEPKHSDTHMTDLLNKTETTRHANEWDLPSLQPETLGVCPPRSTTTCVSSPVVRAFPHGSTQAAASLRAIVQDQSHQNICACFTPRRAPRCEVWDHVPRTLPQTRASGRNPWTQQLPWRATCPGACLRLSDPSASSSDPLDSSWHRPCWSRLVSFAQRPATKRVGRPCARVSRGPSCNRFLCKQNYQSKRRQPTPSRGLCTSTASLFPQTHP